MARPVSITQKQLDYIAKATNAGMTTRAIAEQIGMSYVTVSRYQKKMNIKRQPVAALTFK